MIEALRKVIQRMHYALEVMRICVRWYAAYPLSLRHIEDPMAQVDSDRRSWQSEVATTHSGDDHGNRS
jgi:transposase-like protein